MKSLTDTYSPFQNAKLEATSMNDKPKQTSVAYKDEYLNVSIEIPRGEMTLYEVRDELIMPLLKAAGFSEKLIEEMFA